LFFVKEKVNLKMEIDSLRGKLAEEEIEHKKLQEQLLVEKLKRTMTDLDMDNRSDEIIKG